MSSTANKSILSAPPNNGSKPYILSPQLHKIVEDFRAQMRVAHQDSPNGKPDKGLMGVE